MTTPSSGSDHNEGTRPKGDLSPEEKARFERKLSDLGQRLDKATGGTTGGAATSKAGDKAAEDAANAARSKAMGLGFSIAAQLVAGVLAGGAIGYFLDRWLGSTPWLMVLFLMFGFAAGIMNVVRTAREMQKISEQQSKGAKSVPDDAEDDK
jgi:ATP synthase protein I